MFVFIWLTPRLALESIIFCRWLCLSVCLYLRLSRCSFKLLLLFWPSLLHVALYKSFFFDFRFRPPNSQNLLPKICTCTKSACMADRPEMFGPTRGFSGMAYSMEPCKMLCGRPLLPWLWNFGKFGAIFFHKITYKSACMPDRPDMFGPTRGDDQRGWSLLSWQHLP